MTARRTTVPDPTFDKGGIVQDIPWLYGADRSRRRNLQPFFLLGHPSGEIRISNGYVARGAVRLYRFADKRQAEAAAKIVMLHASLGIDGERWIVPAVRDHHPLNDIDGALRKLDAWARRLAPELEHRLRRLGPGHYSMLERRRQLGLAA